MIGFVKRGGRKYTRLMLKERQADIWSKRVFDLRLHLAVSQEEIAEMLGVARVTISCWETGKYVPQRLHRGLIEKLEKKSGIAESR